MKTWQLWVAPVAMLAAGIGCGAKQQAGANQKSPRPVSVIRLEETNPNRLQPVTGSVASWKTEKIGFEVAGRVEFVVEPETELKGEIFDPEGNLLNEGTVLARLDPTRYELNVASVEAQIQTTKGQRQAVAIEVARVFPARLRAAKAERDLAQSEFARNQRLVKQKAASQRALDKASANLDTAEANISQLEASLEAKKAELASLDATIDQLGESRKSAERDVKDCELISRIPGQVAEVHVIPGSYVGHGEPVVTVQMMDPIKVEFEVSAETARILSHGDPVAVHVSQPDGLEREESGMLYMIDPVADPQTRTFTITVMIRNGKIRRSVPEKLEEQSIARTSRIGKILTGMPGRKRGHFVNVESLQEDGQGAFVWKILDHSTIATASNSAPLLKVAKVRVAPGDSQISILGLFSFREVTINEGETFDIETDRVVGKLESPSGTSQPWDGDTILFDNERWLLRPGDLVRVDLPGDGGEDGLYVPLDAVMEKSGETYVFAVESGSEGGSKVRKISVQVLDTVGTQGRLGAVGSEALEPGMRIIAAGAHYLVDGESVNVIEEVEVAR